MLANCARCGDMFNQTYRDICSNCIEEEEQHLQMVKNYLQENRLATMPDVIRDTDVPLESLMAFIEDRRLLLIDYPNFTYECQECGKPTQNGRYCPKCADKLVQELADATAIVRQMKERTPPTNGGYHSR